MTKKRGGLKDVETGEGDGDLADPSEGGEASTVLAEGEEVVPWSDGKDAGAGQEGEEAADEEEEEEDAEDENAETDELQIWEAADLDLQGDDDDDVPGSASTVPGFGSRR